MKEAFVNISNIPTHIVTCGKWIEETLENVPEIAICITGNPGLPGYYTEFCNELYECLDQKIPVWIIGHLGHDEPSASSLRQVPQLKGNEELFDLDSQIQHKIEFVEKYVPQETKIHLIGHSIGAWIVLQMLQSSSVRTHIKKCYLLFPTLEKMIESPNGWKFTKIALPLYSVFGFFISIINHLPELFKIFLIRLYFWYASIPSHFIGTTLKYIKPTIMEKVIFLAEDEMARVRGLQRDIISENLHLLKLFYGTTDGWVPLEYYRELKKQFADIDAELDTKQIDHSFVLRYSKPMGYIVSKFIRSNSLQF